MSRSAQHGTARHSIVTAHRGGAFGCRLHRDSGVHGMSNGHVGCVPACTTAPATGPV